MVSNRWSRLLAVLVVVLGRILPAHADPAVPVAVGEPIPTSLAHARRPLTLPENVANPVVGFSRTHWPAGAFLDASVGGGFGVTDDLTVRAQPLPLQLGSPRGFVGLHYGQTSEAEGPSASVTYRFLRGDVEIGGSVDVRLLTVTNTSGLVVAPAIPVRAHLTQQLRIDTSPTMRVESKTVRTRRGFRSVDRSETEVGPVVPVSLLYDVAEPFHVAVSSGVTILDLGAVRDTMRIPAGASIGWTMVGERSSVLDISASLRFPGLVLPGATSMTNWDWYVLGIDLSGHFSLGD
jgi:hypothetical protein